MKLARASLVTLLLAVMMFIAAVPVSATPENPDSITLDTTKAFQNIWEDGDILLVATYHITYATEPNETAASTFMLSLYDTNSSTLIRSRPVLHYQYNVYSIYFNPDQASALSWGSEYKVRIMGNPAYFTPEEGTTMATKTLLNWDWVEGAANTSRELLRLYCLNLAVDLGAEKNVTWIETTPEAQFLNAVGSKAFLEAIPSLNTVIPSLFLVSSSVTTGSFNITRQNTTGALANETSYSTQLGTAITAAFAGVGDYLGISTKWVVAAWAMLFIVIIASIIFLNSGNTTAAAVLSIPIVILMIWTGALPMALVFTAGIVVLVLVGYYFWLRGM